MKVLVTGGAGFIGSHIVDALAGGGAGVAVLDNLSTGRIENIRPGVSFYRGDLLDGEFVMGCVEKERPGVIIHQAARASAPGSLKDPAGDAGVNIVGSVNLLEAARACGVRKVVYASSAAVYGNPRRLPVDHLHPVEPLSFYGLSKYTVERYLALYRELYGLDYTVLRYANVYGPRQDPLGEGGVVAVFIGRLLRGEQPVIYGDGEQTRDFIHVSDVVRANLCAIDRGSGMTFNIGTGRPATVNRLFEILKNAFGYRGRPLYRPPRPGDIRDSWLADGRAEKDLGWTAAMDLERGIKNTLDQVR
ncbi:MAG: NAD-dependent epimerase/dehydratase family protein [Peptococcaceae bacterium]|nr:NAD-dependent epimerase/dehydratase family protein [Peptococcaceae bacterium]